MIMRAFPFLSHTLVAGAGWALVMVMRPTLPAPAAEASGVPAEARPVPAKPRSRDSWQGDGGRLLRELAEKRETLDDFHDISPAADRAAAAMAAIQAWRANPGDASLRREASARLSHWLAADPKAAMAYWNQQLLPDNASDEVLASAVANADVATLLACLEPSGGSRLASLNSPQEILLDRLAKSLAATGSTSQLVNALKALHTSYGSMLLGEAVRAWPEDKLDGLASLLAGNKDTNIATAYFQRIPGSQQRAWLQARFGGDVPPDPSQAALLRNLLNRATALSLQERIDWMAKLDQASGRAAGRTASVESLVDQDVTGLLNKLNWEEDGLLGDWRHRLRHDQVTAAEILAEIQRAMPDATAKDPQFLLRTVFKHVAQHAPEGAMELLGGLPQSEREKLMLDSAFFSGGAGNPQALFDLVSTLPPHLGSNANERFKVWLRAANPSVASWGDSYGAWVLAMPHGVERDMALSALGAHFEANDPKAAAAYRAAKTLPPGWKPEK
jgi:hypothetical protein